ncbi:MAG: hypothetical protein R3219_02660 [Hydrogenovibrio sp.]|nr:hypothetical protein [Hydrogenovibrio sp.]
MTRFRTYVIGSSLTLNIVLIFFLLMHSNAMATPPDENFLQQNPYLKKSYLQNQKEYRQLDKKIAKLQYQANHLLMQKDLDEVAYLTLIEKQKVLENEKRQLIASAVFATAANLAPEKRKPFIQSLNPLP